MQKKLTPRKQAPAKPVRTRLGVDQRRAQLLTLGERVFSRAAYAEVSIDAVARQAGISKGLLYHYFPTKRDFYVETMRAAAHLLLQRTRAAEGGAPVERLKASLDAYFAFLGAHGGAYAALLRSGVGLDREVARLVEETRHRFLRRLLMDFGMEKPPPRLRAALGGWVGFVEATALDWVDHRDVDPAVLRDLLTDMLLHAWRFSVAGPSGGL